MPQTLQHHLNNIPHDMRLSVSGDTTIAITSPIVDDNRRVQAGGVFIAREGQTVDGHNFIDDAIQRGAVAIVGSKAMTNLAVPYVQVSQPHLVTGLLAASYYDFPARKLTVFGITGTNGKTTTTHLLHSILKKASDGKAGFISTIGADFGDTGADTGLHVTTPTAPEIQDYLSQMVEAGLTHVILEMTSHGLVQGRLSGVDIDVAIITNVTHEHLDFHGSFENYRAAKGIMFEMLSQSYRKPDTPKVSILNADDDSYRHYSQIETDQIVSYAVHADATYQATNVSYSPTGTHFTIDDTDYSLKLLGEFNVHNALAALSAAKSVGIDEQTIQEGLLAVELISGRMEIIDEGQDFIAIVDFAHTPDALEKALQAGREMLPEGKRLITVFGSAGLRDVEKRYLMAEVAAEFADMTVLTAEDPRTESLDAILEHMAEGCRAKGGVEGETFIRVPDRGQAIYEACQLANAGDMVMACGKGHEQSMCFGTIEYDWDDRDALRAALRGAPLQTLPTATGNA